MGKKNLTQRVVASAEEARLASIAEQMKIKGGGVRTKPDANFEAIYGSTSPGSFSVSNDLQQLSEATGIDSEQLISYSGMIQPEEQVEESNWLPPMQEQEVLQMSTKDANIPLEAVTNMGPTNTEEEQKKQEEVKPPLTPAEKALELSKYIQAYFKERGLSVPVPGPQLIMQWKQMHGDICLLTINDKLFLFRYLKRQEYIQMMAAANWDAMKEHERDDILCEKCLLYPTMTLIEKAGLPANALGMLSAQIKLQSLFLDEMFVSSLVMKF